MKEEWLFHGAVVPIDVETTAALVAEIKRLIDVIGGMALAQPEQEPVDKLREPTSERAWFTIAELNAWADKKLAENPNWVMPKDEPERDEPPPQRTWVDLTRAQFAEILCDDRWQGKPELMLLQAQSKLKDKNTRGQE